MGTETVKRFIVFDSRSQFRRVRSPWLVIDTTTNETVDEWATKKSADADARDRNRAADL